MGLNIEDEKSKKHEPFEIEMPEIEPLVGEETQANMNMYEFFKKDLHSLPLSLTEPTGKIIDVEASFIPEPKFIVSLIRILFFSFSFLSTLHSFASSEEKRMWFGYLTHWTAIITLLYQALILVCSINSSLLPQPKLNESPSFLLRFIWLTYGIALNAEIFVTVLYWTLIHDWSKPPTFVNIALHGIFGVLLTLDGMLIGRIPMRLKHLLFLELYGLSYISWSIVHCFETADDPIYNVLNWNEDPVVATILSITSVLFLIPGIFMFVWFISYTSFCFGGRRILIPP